MERGSGPNEVKGRVCFGVCQSLPMRSDAVMQWGEPLGTAAINVMAECAGLVTLNEARAACRSAGLAGACWDDEV